MDWMWSRADMLQAGIGLAATGTTALAPLSAALPARGTALGHVTDTVVTAAVVTTDERHVPRCRGHGFGTRQGTEEAGVASPP
jgi:hypothetical protein